MIRAVLFDLDGVLVHSEAAWLPLMNAAAEAFGCPAIPPDAFEESFGQGMEADIERFYQGRSVEELSRYFVDHFREHSGGLRVNPAAAQVMATLRSRGYRTAVITNTPSPLAREILATAGLQAEVLVGSGDVPREKPAPDMVIRACRLLSVSCPEALVVGDSRYDREAAEAAGCRFAGLGIEGEIELADLSALLQHLP
jgi:phosphoglycolate phosphatase/AHBA synthesis associated protein